MFLLLMYSPPGENPPPMVRRLPPIYREPEIEEDEFDYLLLLWWMIDW